MFRQLVLEPVTDTAQPAMTKLRSFAEQDIVKLLTATAYNCTIHMFRQLVIKPFTDTAQLAMTELYYYSSCSVTHPKLTNSIF